MRSSRIKLFNRKYTAKLLQSEFGLSASTSKRWVSKGSKWVKTHSTKYDALQAYNWRISKATRRYGGTPAYPFASKKFITSVHVPAEDRTIHVYARLKITYSNRVGWATSIKATTTSLFRKNASRIIDKMQLEAEDSYTDAESVEVVSVWSTVI